MGIRGYQKYNLISTTASDYPWAGVDYTSLAIRADTTLPSGLSVENTVGKSVSTSSSSFSGTHEETFIIPRVFDVLSIMDGTIEGTLKLVATATAGNSPSEISITKAELEIGAIDSSNTYRELEAKQTIWEGAVQAIVSGPQTASIQLLYWIDVLKAIFYADERIVLKYTLTYDGSSGPSVTNFGAKIGVTPDTEETNITLPLVM